MNDYTKNISLSIHSPGLTLKSKGNKFSVDHKKVDPRVSQTPSSTHRRTKSHKFDAKVKRLENDIKSEKSRKSVIKNEIDTLRKSLNSFKNQLKN